LAEKERGQAKEYGETSLALLRKVKNELDKAVKDGGVSCVIVSALEKELNRDPRTIRHHLEILQEAEYGKFSKDGKLFCPKKAEQKTQ
jgi:hypothetical protein